MTNLETAPRLEHNWALAQKFIEEQRVTSRYPKVSEQLPTLPLNRAALKPFGYNPSIIEHDGWLLMAYRYHPDANNRKTWLALSQINPEGEPISCSLVHIEGSSREDPKLFHNPEGFPWMSATVSTVPETPYRCVMVYGLAVNGRLDNQIQPKIGANDWSTMEKNWVFFRHCGQMYVIYQCSPTHKVFRLDNESPGELFEAPGPRWPYGAPRGGTPPLPYEGRLLRFFHSGLDNEFGQYRRRYFVGAYLMEDKPPFTPIRTSTRPILYGSEICDLKVKDRPFHYKPNVVFPGGAVDKGDHWILSCGVNDSSCVLVKVYPRDLHL